jgi:hypothetical protein
MWKTNFSKKIQSYTQHLNASEFPRLVYKHLNDMNIMVGAGWVPSNDPRQPKKTRHRSFFETVPVGTG